MDSVAAPGRPTYLGMLYNSVKDIFTPGINLWDDITMKNATTVIVQPNTSFHTGFQFAASDSLSEKTSLLDHASLKASFCSGPVEVRGSALFLSADACELTLDPNTACRRLSLSEVNRKVTYVGEKQLYPDHPERFGDWPQVLCKEALSACCDCEAEWSGSAAAVIAVACKGIGRKGGNNNWGFGRNNNSWSLYCSDKLHSLAQ